jgi:RNA-splicing ligase RtcB
MIEYKGQYSSCKVFNDEVEPSCVSQIYNVLNCPAFEGSTIRFMPDLHAGKGAVIGFTATLTDKIIPNVIGVDLGCGVSCWELGDIDINFQELDDFIRLKIPYGFDLNKKSVYRNFTTGAFIKQIEETCKRTNQEEKYNKALLALSSLGGGNHYQEVGKSTTGKKLLSLHSGSRNFGLTIANYYQKIANTKNPFGELSWLEGEDKDNYIADMKVAQQYASINRKIMGHTILEYLKLESEFEKVIESVHNYIDFTDNILRKGAISAQKGKVVAIPFNMRDGIVIGMGKGNEDWNYSAPHGAGRVMSRGQAKRELSLDVFKEEMKNVWSSCINEKTLDESPMAYKDSTKIKELIVDTIDVIDNFVPVYNFKAQ